MLLYGDNIDAAPITIPPAADTAGTRLLRSNAARWSGLEPAGAASASSASTDQWVSAGVLSEKQINLRVSTGTPSLAFWAVSSFGVSVKNTLSKVVIGAAFSWSPDGGGTGVARPVIGWNEGLNYSGQSGKPEVFWAETALMLVGGRLQLSGIQAAENFPINSFVFLELELDPVAGTASVYVNDLPVGNLQNVPIAGLTSIARVGFCLGKTAFTYTGSGDVARSIYSIDNLYILDDTGPTFNQRLGPISFKRLPLLAQQAVAFTPVNAGDNISAVNKTDLSELSFNRSPGSNDVGDYFTLDTSALAPDAEVLGLLTNVYAARTDLGPRNLDVVIQQNSEEARKSLPSVSLQFAGTGGPFVFPVAPDATPWSVAKLTDTVFGYEVKE